MADLDYVVNIKSPSSIKAENQTLSGKPVLLQTLRNPLDIYFDVITVKKSNCVGLGEVIRFLKLFTIFNCKLVT